MYEKYSPYLQQIIFLLLSILLLTYTVYRAVTLSVSIDESTTFFNYMPHSYWDIFLYNPALDANNHILNTLFSKFFTGIFGVSEWSLRLTNLLGHVLFLYFSVQFSKLVSDRFLIQLLAFSLLSFNPYVLDFFSLCRGYGLSLAFMMASLFYYFQSIKSDDLFSNYNKSVILAILSVVSNFTFLLYLAALLASANLVYLTLKKENVGWIKSIFSINKYVLAMLFALVVWLLPIIKKLKALGEFQWGGFSGIYEDTFKSVLVNSLYNVGYLKDTVSTFSYLVLGFLLVSISVVLVHFFKNNFNFKKSPGLALLLVPTAIAIATVIQYYLMDVAYLTDRKALIYIPLASLPIIFAFKYIYENGFKVFGVIVAAMIFFNINHFARSQNYNNTREWYFEVHSREMLNLLKEDVEQSNPGKQIKLCTHWTFKNGIQFYIKTKNWDWIEEMKYRAEDKAYFDCDYYYISSEDLKIIKEETKPLRTWDNTYFLLKVDKTPSRKSNVQE